MTYEEAQRVKWNLFARLGYEVLHPEVERFHRSDARIKVALCPARSGKSFAAAKDVAPRIITMPDSVHWIVGPNYELAEKEFRYLHRDLVETLGPKGTGDMPKPLQCHTSPRSGQLYVKFANGAVLQGKSGDNPDSLLGEAVDTIVYAEASRLPRGIREQYCAPRLITRKGVEIVPTTPSFQTEWVDELYEQGRAGKHGIDAFHWDHTANPTYDPAEFERAKRMLGEDNPVFKQQYKGEVTTMAGLVYPAFNPDLHIIEPFKIPDSWPRYRAVDFGRRDPFVCLWLAAGPDGEVYFYREYYERNGGVATPQHAEKIRMLTGEERVLSTVADPSAAQLRQDLAYHGISPILAGDNDRPAGRARVMEYMTPVREGCPPWPHRDKRASRAKWPRLYFFSTLKETLHELKYYRWREGRAVEGDKERTEGADHAMDALRYALMERPSPARDRYVVPRGSFKHWMKRTPERNREGYLNAV